MIIRYLWPVATWSVIVLILTLIPGKALPEVDIFQVDKLVHFFIFGVLMILMSYALYNISLIRGTPSFPILLASLYCIIFGIGIEFLQRYVPGRSFSLADMLANTIGVGLGCLGFLIVKKRLKKEV